MCSRCEIIVGVVRIESCFCDGDETRKAGAPGQCSRSDHPSLALIAHVCTQLAYEDLVSSQGREWKRALIGYLGVAVTDDIMAAMETHSWEGDGTHVRCSERIENWAEVEEALQGMEELELCERDMY